MMPPKAIVRMIGAFHEDDRAQRLLDIFPQWSDGQLNLSYVNSTDHIVAWHAHEHQTDYWICIKGSLKVGLAEPLEESDRCLELGKQPVCRRRGAYGVRFEYLSDKNFRVLEIPPGVYHGYRALELGTILLYFLNHKYNPDDEIRAKVGDFDEEWNTQNK